MSDNRLHSWEWDAIVQRLGNERVPQRVEAIYRCTPSVAIVPIRLDASITEHTQHLLVDADVAALVTFCDVGQHITFPRRSFK